MTSSPLVASTLDHALEATIVLSFSRVGYDVRDRVFGWTDLTERPLAGRVIVVTGATSGLGFAAATRLARLGGSVVIVGRDPGRTTDARGRIATDTGNDDIEAAVADLADLDAVRALATHLTATQTRLDAIVHNAGAMATTHELTADGIEVTVQTHVVAPFLLTRALLPLLASTPGSRVVTVSSGGMYREGLSVDELEMGADGFNGVTAYARAKRAQVVLNEEWSRRAATTAVTFHAMHPGWVDTPGIRSSLPAFSKVLGPLLRTPDQGADTMVWLASAREPLGTNGRFWLDRRPRSTVYVPGTRPSPQEAERLWQWTCARAGVEPDI